MSVTLSSKAFLALFFISFFVRYFRLLINALALVRFKPHALPFAPSFTLKDVTFVMPTTFSRPAETLECLQRVHDCGPAKLVIVTSDDNVDSVQFACKLRGMSGVTVLGVPQLNKRRQMLKGLEHVGTEITFFIDDDVLYPSVDLPKHLLSCFEDPIVGAAGPRQRNRRTNKPNVWNFLGTSYLERRNFNTGATNYIDGGISTLSGRTQAIRTAILKNEEFYKYFCNDSFLGRKLMVDDDKALTRFIYSRGWNIKLNFHKDCTIETTFEEGAKYFSQCIRWARGHWRGNLIVMAKEDYWYRKHLWTLYAVYLSQFQTPAFLMDGSLLVLLQAATTDLEDTARVTVINLLVAWILFSKIVKLLPHLARHPQDCVFVPCGILFSYLHGFINVYALFTTHKTIWGSRATAEDDVVAAVHGPSCYERPRIVRTSHENTDSYCREVQARIGRVSMLHSGHTGKGTNITTSFERWLLSWTGSSQQSSRAGELTCRGRLRRLPESGSKGYLMECDLRLNAYF
ncbi:glycosyltransferase family 2 protein [Myriangium duriaei CBS 260.36]|uniref:Glycosyltransferase family 2 protein n=1 Tax=Myriangium duriaei CBS 260.36 TaxID=1168546 RepID=A0A9P4IQG0_9PEZI|nr:glycosyltransferase family 2 protein [Myriangium duriaei CBS 260.36]